MHYLAKTRKSCKSATFLANLAKPLLFLQKSKNLAELIKNRKKTRLHLLFVITMGKMNYNEIQK